METPSSPNSPQDLFNIPPRNVFEKMVDHVSVKYFAYLLMGTMVVGGITLRRMHMAREEQRHAFASRAESVNTVFSRAANFNLFNLDSSDRAHITQFIQAMKNSNDSLVKWAWDHYHTRELDYHLNIARNKAKEVLAHTKAQCERADSLFKYRDFIQKQQKIRIHLPQTKSVSLPFKLPL